jgi:hypothetical protein
MHTYQYSWRKSNANHPEFANFWTEQLFLAVEKKPTTDKSRSRRSGVSRVWSGTDIPDPRPAGGVKIGWEQWGLDGHRGSLEAKKQWVPLTTFEFRREINRFTKTDQTFLGNSGKKNKQRPGTIC